MTTTQIPATHTFENLGMCGGPHNNAYGLVTYCSWHRPVG
jgi:hypothetical protein